MTLSAERPCRARLVLMNSSIELLIAPRSHDLGGFSVRRVLPYAARRMVGPFVFFDHMGPAEFAPSQGMDVRPHPHIGLATVTYLFEGSIRHRDSLGSDQLIEPGAINWMTAGRGIVHSERTPDRLRDSGQRMHGIQLWVALPLEHEEAEPSFSHHPSAELPEFLVGDVACKLLLGSALGHRSPVPVHSEFFYLDVKMPAGSRLEFPLGTAEAAIYPVEHGVRIGPDRIAAGTMAVLGGGESVTIESDAAAADGTAARLMILGGAPVGGRTIFWNFVASSKEKIEAAKLAWRSGPLAGSRFPPVVGDDSEFIPLS